MKIIAYKPTRLNFRILTPIIVVLIILLIIGIYTSLVQFETLLEKHVSLQIETMEKQLKKEIEHKTHILESTLQLLRDKQSIIDAFKVNDRQLLFDLSYPIYHNLSEQLNITHLYFSDLQRVIFLRVHNPDSYGDIINRATTLSVEKINTMVTGIDLGSFGTLTVRSVSPWHDIKGKKTGYIELGIDISQMLEELSELNDVGLFLAIQKSKLSQNQWEKGQRLFKRSSDWNQFKNFAVSKEYRLSKKLFKSTPNLDLILQAKPGQGPINSISGKTYSWSHITIDTLSHKNFGQIFIAIDISDWVSNYHKNALNILILYFFISILLILTLYRFTNRVQIAESELHHSIQQLKQMSNNLKQQREQLEESISLRNKELDELRVTENRLETAQQIARLGHWELNIIENQLFWSDEVYRIFAVNKGKINESYESFLETIHPEDREYVNKAYTDSLKDKKPYEIEHRLLLKDGTVKYIHEKCETTFDKNGNPIKSIGTVQDISERIHNESLTNRIKHMFENSIEEIYIVDVKSLQFIQVSTGALQNLGYEMEEIKKLTPLDLKPDYTEVVFRQMLEPLRTGKTEQMIFESSHRRKNGSIYPVEVRLQFIDEGMSSIYLVFILDLTERKQSEAELKLHRQHLEQLVEERTATIKMQSSIIDQTNDSIVTTNLEGIVINWNKGAEKMYGYTNEYSLGKVVSIIYHENQNKLSLIEIIESVKEQGNREIEAQLMRADGSFFPAHLSLSLLYNAADFPIGIIGLAVDLSEILKRENELAILTQQLQESNKELEAFSYSVSHDLRAPLRSIDGFSLALIEDYGNQLDDTAQDYLNRVRKSAQRMGKLIDDLLQLSRVNRSVFRVDTVDLKDIAQSIIEELQSNDPERKVNFVIGENMQVQGDTRLLKLVLDNLIGNAWKFTAHTENAQITIKSVAEKPEVIFIKDNGVGFDMRHADKLFGVFQRLHQVTEFPGTGIGLATVQRIIHRHGGQIWAESELGKGAIFYFTLEASIITQTNENEYQGEYDETK